MTHRFDELEMITEKALIASELRLLGFSENGIQMMQHYFDVPKGIECLHQMIEKYKQANDLYGDSQE